MRYRNLFFLKEYWSILIYDKYYSEHYMDKHKKEKRGKNAQALPH